MHIKSFQFNPFQENTYVLSDDTGEAVIIDCGCLSSNDDERLTLYLTTEKLQVKHVLNTHLHLDHSFGNYMAAHTLGVLPEAHQADEFLIGQLIAQSQAFGIQGVIREQPLGGYLQEGDVISFGRTQLEVLHVPGHSPGSICFYCRAENVIFVGDVLFAGSIGRTDLPKGNYAELIAGIQRKLLVLPDETIVYSGHGPATTIGNERVNNPYL